MSRIWGGRRPGFRSLYYAAGQAIQYLINNSGTVLRNNAGEPLRKG